MNTATATQKKITLSTVKSFITKNRENLFINVKSNFDGMTDCVQPKDGGFDKATSNNAELGTQMYDATMGIAGAWFVRGSRDYFTAYEDEKFIGFEVYNSCGCCILAIKK